MRLLTLISSLLAIVISGSLFAGIVDTKHNLSSSGPGTVKTTSGEQGICVFCHSLHRGDPIAPLWNRNSTGQPYTPYNSSTLVALTGQPTGSSVLCLSCHDGTIASGQNNAADKIPDFANLTSPSRLGTDLSDDHPISFAYTSTLAATRGELVNPASLTAKVKLDDSGQMQCTTCHDPHSNDYGKFLVKSNTASAICNTCHVKDYWLETAHSTSMATWNNAAADPWPHTSETTVENNACENCHRPHTAGNPQRILNYAAEENNCLTCHNGNVASLNIEAEFNKFSSHPISLTQGVHDAAETSPVATRHAECSDCHNPHAANTSNPLNGVAGINILGSEVSQVTKPYELCLRCHGDSVNKPAAVTTRLIEQTNLRLEFETSNASYHPVAGVGNNPDVPSLLAPYTTSSQISCLDCHNNNSTGGTAPNGPHGSIYSPLLSLQYVTADNTPESAANYALCYKCHSQNSIMNDQSFPSHNRHLSTVATSCNTCHDPHGVSATQSNNTNLINFDLSIVSPNIAGGLKFTDKGLFTGSCSLSCHGVDHCEYNYAAGLPSSNNGGPCGP